MILLGAGVVLALLLAGLAFRLAYRVVAQLGSIIAEVEQLDEQLANATLPPPWTVGISEELFIIRSRPRHTPGQIAGGSCAAAELLPSLLYISPAVPTAGGTGLGMRCGMVLRTLAERYRVTLLVLPLYVPAFPVPSPFAELCEEWAVVPLSSREKRTLLQPWATLPFAPGSGESVFWNRTFDVVHVFRLFMLPVARFYLPSCERHHLDLDGIESRTHWRLGDFYEHQGLVDETAEERYFQERFHALEIEAVQRFDRIYVCAQGDRDELLGRAPASASQADVCVLPNVVSIPPTISPSKSPEGPFNFLFIASLSYHANSDAIDYFCTQVLPLIRGRVARDISVTIVGQGSTAAIDGLRDLPGVHLIGEVPDVATWYADADAVIVPMRTGGGASIRILEAFSYRRPVVSTSLGMEGIDARDGEEILLGDTAEAFADQCARLIDSTATAQPSGPDAAPGVRIAENAYALLLREYTPEAMGRAYETCPPHGRSQEAGATAGPAS